MIRLLALLRLHEAHAQVVEQILEELRFGVGSGCRASSPAACAMISIICPAAAMFGSARLAGPRIGDVAEVHRGRLASDRMKPVKVMPDSS